MRVACLRKLWCSYPLVLLLIFAACSSQASSPSATSTPTIVTGSSGSEKPLITGLVDMGYIPFNHDYTMLPDNSLTAVESYPGAFRGMVINVTWAQLQPTSQTFDPGVIDQALSAITAYNQSHPTAPLLAKLRVWGGGHSPDWAKQIGGPITVVFQSTSNAPVTLTVGAFWSQPYIQAWTHLQSLLAARYDTNPLIVSVPATSCATVTDEPFILPLSKPSSTNLLAAGFTDAAYKNCLLHETDVYSAWKYTRIETIYNPYHTIGGGKMTTDTSVTIQAMQACRTALGSRCILGNHCLGRCDQSTTADIYAEMKKLGAPIALQTASPTFMTKNASNWSAVLQRATGYGASSVELWPAGFTQFSQATVQQWTHLLPTT